jgi:hypothetical protein
MPTDGGFFIYEGYVISNLHVLDLVVANTVEVSFI